MVDNFMKDKGYITTGGTLKCAIARKEEKKSGWMERLKNQDRKKIPEVEYYGGNGQHVFTFNGKKIFYEKYVDT